MCILFIQRTNNLIIKEDNLIQYQIPQDIISFDIAKLYDEARKEIKDIILQAAIISEYKRKFH